MSEETAPNGKKKAPPRKQKGPKRTIDLSKKAGPVAHRCGRCKAPASYGSEYPGERAQVPPHRAGKVLWACPAHHPDAQRVVIGWCEADGNMEWARRLTAGLIEWEARCSFSALSAAAS